MTEQEILTALNRIFYVLRDYQKKTVTKKIILEIVCLKLSKLYDIRIHDKKTIAIGNELFEIFSYKTYLCYDVKHVGQEK